MVRSFLLLLPGVNEHYLPSLVAATARPPVFSVVYERNPLDSQADYRLQLEMQPLEVVYSHACIDNIGAHAVADNFLSRHSHTLLLFPSLSAKFFATQHSTTLLELELEARRHMQALRTQTATRFVEEVNNHKTMDLRVNLSVRRALPVVLGNVLSL